MKTQTKGNLPESDTYSIEVTGNGLFVRGPLPIRDMKLVTRYGKSLGFDQIDFGMAQTLGATLVVTSREGSESMRAELTRRNAHLSKENAWLQGSDMSATKWNSLPD